MDFDLSDTERLFRSTVTDVISRYIDPLVSEHPADRPCTAEQMLDMYGHLGALGLLGARTPQAEGGNELSHVMLGIAMETLPAFLGISMVAHESTVRRISMTDGGSSARKFLPDLVAGRRITGSATSEPNAGSDPRSIETRAVRKGSSYVLNGTKLWVSNGSVADVLVVVVTMGKDDNGRNLITRILVDREESPFEVREIPTLGLRRGHLAEVNFDDCEVPAENLLGEPGDAHSALTATWHGNRPCLGLIAVGLAQRAFDASIGYAKQRVQFDQRIGRFQLIQEMLADMATDIAAARLLSYRAMALLDQAKWPPIETSMAKYFGTEMAVRVTSKAIQIHGTYGLTTEFPVEEWYRDARMLPLPDGTTQIQKLIIGRELTGERAFA